MDIKSRIGKKADELFRRYGVKSITMDEISEQLGISKKTIYQSFSDKNELVDKVVMDMLHKNQCSCEVRTKKAENAVQEVFLNMENVQSMYADLNPSFVHDIERGHPAVATLALWRRQGFRPLHDHQLPRVVRHARLERHPVQS